MKKLLLILISLFVFTAAQTQGQTCIGNLADIDVLSTGAGTNISFTEHSGFAGLLNITVNGVPNLTYCINLYGQVGPPDPNYTDTCSNAASSIRYILNNLYPHNSTLYGGRLSDINQEVAAIQAAIWYFSDNITLNSITDATIRDRALAIKADAETNGLSEPLIITFSLHPGVNPDDFYVRTTDYQGHPISVSNISLSISSGSLGTAITATDSSMDGVSPDIAVMGASNGSVISAYATCSYPIGKVIHGIDGNRQILIIALPSNGPMGVSMEWGALPVELSSFTSTVSGSTVQLYWSTANEINNSGFDIERSEAGVQEWSKVGFVSGHGTVQETKQYTYTDNHLNSGIYQYRLRQIDYNGHYEYFNLSNEIVIGTPMTYHLSQNYPNPFNPSTTIGYNLKETGMVNITVFDLTGREIATLVNETKTAGYYTVDFNASSLSSGTYFYRIHAGDFTAIRKMTLVK